ncbi:ABC transporter substrate-binding protein [Halobacillus mangrovi]|uniref:ABC transporter substrate-binding protein n=1 Tax=Halobacillus mangrovi TaxID=402384 RepID=A0A1W5ZZ53_9BACI|nr:ABC transporter substrate-binding protein [Halobacillus mangrovi]ARI78563.1 ABC transporter substrate-binding protein [Halobacillus mangrovi]
MNHLWKNLLSLFLVIGLLTGCTSGGDEGAGSTSEDSQGQTEQANSGEQTGTSYPFTATDALDQEVTFEKEPEKIISTIPSNGEILFTLGLSEEIVGVSDYANYPEEATQKEKIGGQDLNVEKILSLEPDLVLAHASGAHNSEQALEQIRDAGIKVFVVQEATSFEAVYESIQTIGKVTGASEKAEKIVTGMKEDLEAIKEKASGIAEEDKKDVFIEVSPAPEIYSGGKGTFLNEMLQAINANNVVGDQEGWFKMNNEAIVELQPEVIITTYGYYTENPKEKVLSREGWGSVPAIEKEQVYDVHSDLVTRPGPRLVEGVNELGKAIYPEVFSE